VNVAATDLDLALPDLADIRIAADRLAPHIHRTPVVTCASLDRWAGRELHLKCEHLQRTGAFKFRGATNAVLLLPAHRAALGVAAHSSGNHAGALAAAARARAIPAHLVMPEDAPAVKRAAVESYGGHVTTCAATLADRERVLAEVVARTGATEVHPYDDARVIAGAGTAALELLEAVDGLDAVIAPVGGGGLLSGTAIAVKALRPTTKVFGAEPTGADDAARSLDSGRIVPSAAPDTIADGLLTSLSPRTFAALRRHVDGIVTVGDDETIAAMRLVWERAKLVVEPSAAVAVAAARRLGGEGRRIGVLLSGGNVDLDRLPFNAP
jgi:threonine dehydratase